MVEPEISHRPGNTSGDDQPGAGAGAADELPHTHAWFTTTHWSVVLAAQPMDGSPGSHEALQRLCQTYWYPLYAFARRSGRDPHTAQDLTQGFFAKLLEKKSLETVRREKGRFRNFLIKSFKHFLSDEWDKDRAGKRGGGIRPISFDEAAAEERYRAEPTDGMDPEKLIERKWAVAVLQQATERLRLKCAADGREAVFELFQDFGEGGPGKLSIAEIARKLGKSVPWVKTEFSRMRARLKKLVREEVANTVSSPAEIDEELRHIRDMLSQ